MKKAISDGITTALCMLGFLWLLSNFVGPILEWFEGVMMAVLVGIGSAAGTFWREKAVQ